MQSLYRTFYGWLVAKVGLKAIKYALASVVSVVVTEVVLFLVFGVFRLFSAEVSNIVATAVAAVPSYYLNRNWAWGKSGKSHFLREIVPFWTLAFIGLALSLVTVGLAQSFAQTHHLSHLADALFVNFASLLAFGVVWVGKFFIFNIWLFVETATSEVEPL
ncbi:GtrA family protein [Ferrimicrobium sp.]|uniref:GtrA family protein n=1 Tax=Ferrimicrobium sp. TaxID=2926050 RepID=UPI00261D07BE|nr:GtrA family protein [Ferrimicrobium sp.]